MFAVNKILLPVEFSEQCAGAARYAIALASRFQSEMTLLHVVSPPRLVGGPEIGMPTPVGLSAAQLARAKADLEMFLSADLAGLPVQRIVVEGDPAREIVQHVQSGQPDLIVMPTHGYGPFRRFLLGSVVAKVLHDVDSPVWTGVHMAEAASAGSLSVRRIACAIDPGPHAERVLSWAWGMASEFAARLSVIHVMPPVGIAVVGASEPEPEVERAEQGRGEIEELLAKTGAKAEIAVGSGDIVEEVYDFAAGLPADLLVIGRGAAKGIVGRLRTHAYNIIRESPCPVVSV